jgi:hypothetical protein
LAGVAFGHRYALLATSTTATLKYKIYKLMAFLKTLKKLKQEWQKSPALGPGKQTEKLGLVWRNRKKISQIINAYLYLPFFILIIYAMSKGFVTANLKVTSNNC